VQGVDNVSILWYYCIIKSEKDEHTMTKRWTEDELDILIENYGKLTNRQIGELIGKSSSAVQLKSRKIGLQTQLKYQYNKDYFYVIDTEEKAYWLGFIFADGYVIYDKQRRNYEFGIELHEDDFKHLEKLNNSLDSNIEVSYRTRKDGFKDKYGGKMHNTSFIRYYSIKLVEDLMQYGVVQNKTYTDMTLPDIEEELMWHFLRGFLDGDGHMYSNTVKDYQYLKIGFTNLSRTLLESIQLFLSKNNIVSHITKNQKDKNTLQLSITATESIIKFYNKTYSNPKIYLDRKFVKYQELIKIAL